jgi:hypothetical protein
MARHLSRADASKPSPDDSSYFDAPKPTTSNTNYFDAINLPPELRPLGAWAYLGLSVLFVIPIVGWIFLIVFCISDANINRRNFARAYTCVFLATVALFVGLYATGTLNDFIQAAANGTLGEYFSFLPWMTKA